MTDSGTGMAAVAGEGPAGLREEALTRIDAIVDPCSKAFGRPAGLVGMGMIDRLDIDDGAVAVTVLPTFPGLPLPRRLRGGNREGTQRRSPGAGRSKIAFAPPEQTWEEERMSPAVRAALRRDRDTSPGEPRMSTADLRPVLVAGANSRAFCRRLIEAAGATPEHAAIVVDHLIEADTMGLKSHGVMRVPQYIEDIANGGIDPVAAPAIRTIAPGRAAADGTRGFGQVVGVAMAKTAVDLGRQTGVAFVTGRHMGHTGRIGAYAEVIASAGLLGIVVCSGPRSGHFVAPFGGREGRLATNPIAYAYPVEGELAGRRRLFDERRARRRRPQPQAPRPPRA